MFFRPGNLVFSHCAIPRLNCVGTKTFSGSLMLFPQRYLDYYVCGYFVCSEEVVYLGGKKESCYSLSCESGECAYNDDVQI